MTLRIGIVKVGAMGDVITTTPFVRQLRGHFPDATIHYHAGEPCVGVLKGNPNIDELFSFDPAIFYQKKWGEVWTWIRSMSARRYDYLFMLDKKLPYALACRLIAPKRSFGFARSPLHRFLLDDVAPYGAARRHEAHYYLDLLKPLFTPSYAPEDCHLQFGPELPAVESIPAATNLPKGPFDVWVNSGGLNARETGSIRRLSPALFRRIQEYHTARIPVVLLGAADDAAFYERELPSSIPSIRLAGKLKLAESARIMQMARCVFTTECGAMHLAGCVQDRLVVFLGPTHPLRRLPPGRSSIAVWHDEDIYDDHYDTHGTRPTKNFFTKEDLIFNDFTAALQKIESTS